MREHREVAELVEVDVEENELLDADDPLRDSGEEDGVVEDQAAGVDQRVEDIVWNRLKELQLI